MFDFRIKGILGAINQIVELSTTVCYTDSLVKYTRSMVRAQNGSNLFKIESRI